MNIYSLVFITPNHSAKSNCVSNVMAILKAEERSVV